MLLVGHHRGQRGRHRPRPDGQRLETGDLGIAVDQFPPAQRVDQIDPVSIMPRNAGHGPGVRIGAELGQEQVLAQWIRAAETDRRIAFRLRKLGLRRQTRDRFQAVLGDRAVDQDQRPGVNRVVPGRGRDDLVRAGNGPRLADPAGVRGVVAEVVTGSRAIGPDGPQAERRDHRPVDIVPSRPENLPVGHHHRIPFVGFAERELADVRPVRVATIEEIGGAIAVAVVAAHAALVARRDEGDSAVGQVAGIVVLAQHGHAARVAEFENSGRVRVSTSATVEGSSSRPVICRRPVPSAWISYRKNCHWSRGGV